jgi:hypothetical protein
MRPPRLPGRNKEVGCLQARGRSAHAGLIHRSRRLYLETAPGCPAQLVNTPPHRNPLHLPHSSTQINLQNFAGYFSEFSTLINVRERMTSETMSSRSNSAHTGRLSRPTYRQMGRNCPETSAKHPESAPKLNVLTTLHLKSNRNSSLRDPPSADVLIHQDFA